MKKFLLLSALVALLLSLSACGGNGGGTTPTGTATTPDTPPTTAYETIDDIAEALEDAQADEVSPDLPGDYYTFGDNFIIYAVASRHGDPPGPLEITFGAEPTFTVIDYIPEDLLSGLSGQHTELLYGRTFIRIPVTITNLHDDHLSNPFLHLFGTRLILPDGTASFTGGYVGDNPAHDPLNHSLGAIMTVLANRYDIGRIDATLSGVGSPGSTVESYLHIWYTGDRDYVIRLPRGGGENTYLVFPITMP